MFQLARWSVFLVLMVSYLLVYFHRIAPGVLSADLMAAFNTTGATLGSLAAMYFYIYTTMQIPSGVLADTLGTRKAITVGHAVAGAGSVVFAMAGSLETASLGRLMIGLGVSTFYASIMKCNAMWFPERRFGLISGLTILVGNLGAVLSAGPLAAVLVSVSWRSVFLGIGAISFLLGILVLVVVRNRPEDAGFPPVCEIEGGHPVPERHQHWLKDLWSVVRTADIWPGFWINVGAGGSMFVFIGLWGVPYLRDVHGLSRSQAANHMTVMLMACAAGSLFSGWLSDRLGRRKPVLVGGTLIYALSWLALMYLPWSPGLAGYLLLSVLGFSGVSVFLTAPCAKEVVNPALAGMAIALVNTGNFLGTSILQPGFGWILDLTWNGTRNGDVRVYSAADYRHGFLLLLGVTVVSMLGLLKLRETHCRNVTTPTRSPI
jgi:sugar phosphate permease